MPWEGLWIPVAQALADRRHVEREESRPPITDDDVRWLQREVGPTSLKTWVLAGAPFSDSSTASSSPTFAANRTASPPHRNRSSGIRSQRRTGSHERSSGPPCRRTP